MSGDRPSDQEVAERTEADGHIGLCEAALAREVQASRKLVADLRALHHVDELDQWCKQDGFSWPCQTIRMIEEADL